MSDHAKGTDHPVQGRARPLAWGLAGVVLGLVIYIVKLWVAPAAAPDDATVFVVGGALLGLIGHVLHRRRRRRSDAG